jgi:hypothetical protein
MYFVGFSTATVIASLILFQGFNTTDATNTLSLLCGFVVTFLGVHLLNLSRIPDPVLMQHEHHTALESGLMMPRMSLQGRVSIDGWNGIADPRSEGGRFSAGHRRSGSSYRPQTLFNAFEEESVEAVGLQRLREDDEEDPDDDDADERTHLRSGEQAMHRQASRSNSHSPISQGDARR